MKHLAAARAWLDSGEDVDEKNIAFWCERISQRLHVLPDDSPERPDLFEALLLLREKLPG